MNRMRSKARPLKGLSDHLWMVSASRRAGARTLTALLLTAALLALAGCSGGTAGRGTQADSGPEMSVDGSVHADSSQGSRDSADASDSREAGSEEEGTVPMKEDAVYLSIATVGDWEGILRGNLMEKYCRKVREWSDGTLDIRVYYGGTLGSDMDMIEGVQEGTLSIINSVPSYQTPAVPEAAMLDTPGLFLSLEDYNHFIEGEYRETLQGYYRKAGLRLLSSKAYCYRILTSCYEVADMEDLKGLRLRTMENQYQVLFWQSMGCIATPMNYGAVRVAIQQNMLSAQENPLGYMFSSNLQDVQGYVLLTNHMPMISNYLMNEEQYQELSEEHKEILDRFFREMEQELVDGEAAEEEQMRVTLEQRGYVFTEASEDVKKGIQEGRDAVLKQMRRNLGDRVVDEFLDALEKSRRS